MSFDEAQMRNALPVPADQYGNPGPGGAYDYFDVVALNPPVDATYAEIDLLYQPTSWEYIQFLYLANDGSVAFLALTGADLLEAWRATGMAEPEVMASATWVAPPPVDCSDGQANDNDGDGVCDAEDNCPNSPNPDQRDSLRNGLGDACDPNCSPNPDGSYLCSSRDCSAAPMQESTAPILLLFGLVALAVRRLRWS